MDYENEIQKNEEPETEYRLGEDGVIDENDNPVYCDAAGCEGRACVLVGAGRIALCGACADIWDAGFRKGKEAATALLEACKEVVKWQREHDSGEGELYGLDFVTTCIYAIERAERRKHEF